MNLDSKTKNIININIKDKVKKDKDKNIKDIKEKNDKYINKKGEILKHYTSYNMTIDLSSSQDAKNFFNSFRKMSIEYKNKLSKNK